MSSKAAKYIFYIIRFVKSSNKRKVVNELSREIRKKGLVNGTQSLLHKKAYGNMPDHEIDHDPKAELEIKEYDKTLKTVLPQNTDPLVSIIIPTYNQVDYTYNCICTIKENIEFTGYEIIIADDNSTESTELLRENFEHLIIIRNETNLGFLKNCNNAATKARGQYLVFLNNDTQVQKGWLEELLYIFDHVKDAGIVGSKMVYPDGRLQEAGGVIWKDGSAMNYGNTGNPNLPEFNYVKEVDYISGASIMIKKLLWQEIGGFDEMYLPAYCEDSDICFKARARGYKVIYQPFSVIVHFEGITHGTDLDKGVKQYQVINQKHLKERWLKEISAKAPKGEKVFSERDRTTNKKHVLVVDHYLPQIDKDAGSRTISNFIDVLLELGYSVKFLGENSNTSPHYQKQFQLKGVEVLYGSQYNFATQSWRHYLKSHLDDFDAILLSRSSVCKPILSFLLQNNYKGNTIYYGHDLGFIRLEKEAINKHDDSLTKLANRIKADEDFMYSHATNSLAINTGEIAYLRNYITRPIHYVPPYFFEKEKDSVPYESRQGILFVGGFNHPPNLDAMIWFLDKVYAPLHEQGISLTIVGSKMPARIFKYKDKFRLLQVIPDAPNEVLDRLYAGIRISIAPLLSGAGVKGKVIEAMAKGVPVVGTDIAFEGMPKDNDYLYKGINTADGMTEEIQRIYTNKAVWEKYAAFGGNYVAAHFNKESMMRVFKGLIG